MIKHQTVFYRLNYKHMFDVHLKEFLKVRSIKYLQLKSVFSFKDNLTLCPISDLFRLSVFRPNVYGLFTARILDRDQYENYILHLIANDNGDRPIRTEQRRLSSRQSSSLNIEDFLKRRLD
jgi:hypothetical protein